VACGLWVGKPTERHTSALLTVQLWSLESTRRRAQAKGKRHLRLVVCFPLVLTAPTAPTLAFVVLPARRSLEYVNVEVGGGTEIYIFGPTLYFFLPACLSVQSI
jgi:hypothetical protein